MFESSLGIFLFLLPVILTISYFIFRYLLIGKNISKDLVIVEYQPPKDLRPIFTGLLYDGKITTKDVIAELVSFIIQKKISGKRITTNLPDGVKSDYELTLTNSVDIHNDPITLWLINYFFFGNYSSGAKTRCSLFWKLFEEVEVENISNYLVQIQEEIEKNSVKAGIFLDNPKINRIHQKIGQALFIFALFLTAPFPDVDIPTNMIMFMTGFMLSGVIFIMARRLNYAGRTEYGKKLHNYLLGLKQYLLKNKNRYEKYNLEVGHDESFTELLPYAIALGVTRKTLIPVEIDLGKYDLETVKILRKSIRSN